MRRLGTRTFDQALADLVGALERLRLAARRPPYRPDAQVAALLCTALATSVKDGTADIEAMRAMILTVNDWTVKS